MKIILINPRFERITERELTANMQALYQLLDCKTTELLKVECLQGFDGFYVDYYSHLTDKREFKIKGASRPIRGRAAVIGFDNHGNWVDPATSLETLKSHIRFL